MVSLPLPWLLLSRSGFLLLMLSSPCWFLIAGSASRVASLSRTLSRTLLALQLPAGQNATVAVMSYSGYDIEDAIVLNKYSLDRGFGRCLTLRRYSTVIKKYPNSTHDRVVRPPLITPENKDDHILSRYSPLDPGDGIAMPGEEIKSGQVGCFFFLVCGSGVSGSCCPHASLILAHFQFCSMLLLGCCAHAVYVYLLVYFCVCVLLLVCV
jgi:RNA polymerase Rpb2, domain 6